MKYLIFLVLLLIGCKTQPVSQPINQELTFIRALDSLQALYVKRLDSVTAIYADREKQFTITGNESVQRIKEQVNEFSKVELRDDQPQRSSEDEYYTTKDGVKHKIETGSRGGRYYITPKGDKRYLKK